MTQMKIYRQTKAKTKRKNRKISPKKDLYAEKIFLLVPPLFPIATILSPLFC